MFSGPSSQTDSRGDVADFLQSFKRPAQHAAAEVSYDLLGLTVAYELTDVWRFGLCGLQSKRV